LSKNTVTGPGGVTVRLSAAERVVAPLVPTTWNAVVAAAAPLVVTVSVLLTLPLAGGVTGDALKEQVAPAGKPVQARLTALEKPPVDVTVQVLVVLPVCGTDRLAGAQATLKSGVVVVVGVPLTQALVGP
jgi:hypothetical protein